ncbi:MAG: NAD(P)H-hydrate dehydratase [Oscillospiraceae bacterium]|nr:NAD(P)H-hydrate dehydratase [Oscillospiraceae bacterium]
MGFVVNTKQMKLAEADCDARFISYSEMMKNAGNAVAARIVAECKPCRAAVLCGAGNNGGDGFVIAARLAEKGFNTRVILLSGEPKTDCARGYFEELSGERIYSLSDDEQTCTAFVRNAELVVDCVFGTGFHGALPEAAARIFSAAENCHVRVAVDIPSGVDSDTGEFDPRCFKPTRTFILAAFKKGLLSPKAMELLGDFETLDIGINADCYKEFEAKLTDDSARSVLPKRTKTSHKGTFGRLLNIAGSLNYSGAAVMSTRAALRSGAGLCTLASPISTVKALSGSLVENTFLPLPETEDGFLSDAAAEKIADTLSKMTAVSIGCGLGNSENTRKITEFVIRNADCPIIIDADGINSIAANINVLKERTGKTVITPHPLEFSRISGLSAEEIQADRIGAAKHTAREYGVVVLLKGAYSIITDGSETLVNPTGNAALAKGGSGDVLTGIIAAMLAQGVSVLSAAASGAYCHGFAADLLAEEKSPASIIASDIIEALPRVFK